MADMPPKQPVTGTASVRMDTGSALPRMEDELGDAVPVTPASPPPPPQGMSASAALVTMHDAASQSGGDAFRVLKAFQDYLESERQRARRRMTILGCVFAAVIVVVVGAFMAIWFATMRNMQATNAQLLQAALSSRERETPQPVVAPQPQPSAADTAKAVAEAIATAQAEQSATFAKAIEDMNASLEAMRESSRKAEAERIKAEEVARKALAEKAAAEKAAKEAAAKALAEKAAAEKAAKEAAAKALAEKEAREKAAKAAAAKAAQEKAAAAKAAASSNPAPILPRDDPSRGSAAPILPRDDTSRGSAAPAKPTLTIPRYDAPPPPEGFMQESMAVRLPREPHPVFWRIYMPK